MNKEKRNTLIVMGVICVFVVIALTYRHFNDNPPLFKEDNREIVFMTPVNCNPQLCQELSVETSKYAEIIGFEFRNVVYDDQSKLNVPAIFVMDSSRMTSIMAADNKETISKYLCMVTEHEEICRISNPSIPVVKKDVPEVELFVMSHCPFGLQIEKGILPVLQALEGKIDFKLRFVHYIMHGNKEITEQIRQHCVQEVYGDKMIVPYLHCITDKGNWDYCFNLLEINLTAMNDCYNETESKYHIIDMAKNKSTYISGRFPRFDIDRDLNLKYGVKGSPALVINGFQVQSNRDSNSLLKTICSRFENPPEECNQELETRVPTTGIGHDFGGSSAGSCS